MCNLEHFRCFLKGSVFWNDWRHSEPEVIPDLSGIFIRKSKLIGYDLSKTILDNSKFQDSELQKINFSQASLSNVKFSFSQISNCFFAEADVINSFFFYSKIFDTNFFSCNLTNCNFLYSQLDRLIFFSISFFNLIIDKVEINTCRFSEATMEQSLFKNTELVNCTFSDVLIRSNKTYKSNMTNCKFFGLKLEYSIFSSSRIEESKFSRIQINNSGLLGITLSQSEFYRSTIDARLFADIQIGFISFLDVSFTNIESLRNVYFFSPCHLDFLTIKNCDGRIPKEFSRRCGLSDLESEMCKIINLDLTPNEITEIAYSVINIRIGNPIMYYSCFISHSSQDIEFAKLLYDRLQKNGITCWFAPEDQKIGSPIRKTIGEQIRIKEKIILVISEHSINSVWVEDEVEKAIEEEKRSKKLKLFPIRLDNAVDNSVDSWAETIKLKRHIGDFSNWKNPDELNKAIKKLLSDLKI